MPVINSPSLRRSALCLALLGVAPSAFAQTDPRHQQPTDLDAVLVRASPLPASVEDMTQPVEVLTGTRLDEAKGATLGDTVGKLPGVQSSNFGAGVGRPIIRGLDGARVAVVSDGMGTQDVSSLSQDHNVAIEPFLADQIEVLKGPATLLYGSGAIGGVVNVIDGRIAERALDETIKGRAELRWDSVANGPTGMVRVDAMTTEQFVVHADAAVRRHNDYDTPLGRQPNSFVDTESAALGVSRVGDVGFAGIAVSRFNDRYGNPGEPGDPAEGEPGVSLDLEQSRIEAKAGYTRPFGIFTSLRGSIAKTEYEHTEFEGTEIGTLFVNDGTEARVELTHQVMGAWTGALGLQASERSFEAIGEEAFIPRTRTTAGGLFLMEQGKWVHLQLDLGARIDRVKSRPDDAETLTFSPLSLSAGALWRFNDMWRLSVNLDRAERAPAEEELFADGPHVATGTFEIGDAGLRKERATQAEIGMHFHGQRFDAKASVYQTRFDGFIYLTDTGEIEDDLPVRQWVQADARFRGFEAEATAHLIDDGRNTLDLRVFGDQVRATLDAGGNLPRIAPGRFGADLRWDNGSWRASLGAIRTQRQDDVAVGETPTDGYTLVDSHVAYHWDRGDTGWEVFLDGKNLTDAQARVHTSFLKDRVLLGGRGVALGVRVFF